MTQELASYNVAEAKRHFRELIARVGAGERIVIARRGTPVMALVPPDEVTSAPPYRPVGLAAIAGALSDWQDFDEVMHEITRRATRREIGLLRISIKGVLLRY